MAATASTSAPLWFRSLTKRLSGKGKLHIEFHSPDELPEGACITFSPLTLHIIKRIWDDAGAGQTYARFIVAHEIGHIVLHDELAVAFSNDKEAILRICRRKNPPRRRQMTLRTYS